MTFVTSLFWGSGGQADIEIADHAPFDFTQSQDEEFVIVERTFKEEANSEDFDVVSASDVEAFFVAQGRSPPTEEEWRHEIWLGKQELSNGIAHLVIEVGRYRLLRKIPIDQVPASSQVLMDAIKRPQYMRNIWLKDMDIPEYDVYRGLTIVHRSRTKYDIALREKWLYLARLGVAAEKLHDPLVLATAISALRYKNTKANAVDEQKCTTDVLEYVYVNTKEGSAFRAALVDLAITTTNFPRYFDGPVAFLKEVDAELMRVENDVDANKENELFRRRDPASQPYPSRPLPCPPSRIPKPKSQISSPHSNPTRLERGLFLDQTLTQPIDRSNSVLQDQYSISYTESAHAPRTRQPRLQAHHDFETIPTHGDEVTQDHSSTSRSNLIREPRNPVSVEKLKEAATKGAQGSRNFAWKW